MSNIQRLHHTGPLTPLPKIAVIEPPELKPIAVSATIQPSAKTVERPKIKSDKPPELPDTASLFDKIESFSSKKIKAAADKLLKPSRLAEFIGKLTSHPLMHMTTKEMVSTLMSCRSGSSSRYTCVIRGADEIEKSGILQDCRLLDLRKVSAPKLQYDRNVADDAILVMQDFGKMSAQEIATLKQKAYEHPDVKKDLAEAVKAGYYGSEQHKQYGALIEATTGGIISAEEAMAMNPAGGIPGDGMKKLPILSRFDSVNRHAMRHDATGFLYKRFHVGPGYGGSPLPLNKDNPMTGQIYGLTREIFIKESVLPSYAHVGPPIDRPPDTMPT